MIVKVMIEIRHCLKHLSLLTRTVKIKPVAKLFSQCYRKIDLYIRKYLMSSPHQVLIKLMALNTPFRHRKSNIYNLKAN